MNKQELCKLGLKVKRAWDELALYGAHEGDCDFGPPCKECGQPTGHCAKHAAAFREREMGMNSAMKELLVMIDVINEAGTELVDSEGKETT
jgi:hypothetical protein